MHGTALNPVMGPSDGFGESSVSLSPSSGHLNSGGVEGGGDIQPELLIISVLGTSQVLAYPASDYSTRNHKKIGRKLE